ncbi:Arc family DNA-binding protein [uncultured Acinetobacter sp.]|uniref:Arc family DNA-binding protein n=1 Tax=uncultured Acinetobacter sp. TaxID=165433 RepID=UPI0037489479
MADIQFNLRIPEELKDKIKDAASQSGRSINAEAQMRLEESFNEKKFSELDLNLAVNGYLNGFFAGSAAAYKSRIDAITSEHGEVPKNEKDRLFLEVLKILHSQYEDELMKVNERKIAIKR